MKKFLHLLVPFLLIQCGSEEKKTTTEIIDSQDLASIQNKKAEVVKTPQCS